MKNVFANAEWVKSSRSGAAGHCVEVAFLADRTVGVRDSKDPEGPKLNFTRDEWSAFVAGVANSEFDLI